MSPETLAATYAAAGRWIAYLSIVILGGAAGFHLVVRRTWRAPAGEAAPRLERRLRRTALIAASVLTGATVFRFYAQTYAIFGVDEPITWESVHIVASTGWGVAWHWQLGAALLGVVLLTVAQFVERGLGWTMATAAVAAIATVPLTGHAVSGDGGVIVSVAAQVGHVTGASLWIGTLFAVAVVLRPQSPEAFTAAIRAFSPLAVGAVTVLVLTGVATTVMYLDAPSDLWTSVYGRTLVAKVVVFGVAAGLGAYNWRKLRPALERQGTVPRLRRSATVELLAAALVLGVTAVLVALPLLGH